MLTRAEALDALQSQETVDVLIIGAGINGIGAFRDLAAQGLRVVMVDTGDFCSGTSAAPSRLAHGGLRYLETREFDLVRESVRERDLLLRNAPHTVRPMPVWLPVYDRFSGFIASLARAAGIRISSGRKGLLPIKLGLSLYDLFASSSRALPPHTVFSGVEARQRMPALDPAISWMACYYDARLTHAERLGVELVADGEADNQNAVALPYMQAESAHGKTVELRDQLGGETFRLRPHAIVNTAGAWVDRVNNVLGITTTLVGGNKGSHLVLQRPDLAAALEDRMLYFQTSDNRACLIYALSHATVLLGTTDIPVASADDNVCSDAEIDYLFGVAQEVLPNVTLQRADIVFTYAGVRPLPRSEGLNPGDVSRGHSVRRHDIGEDESIPVFTLVGGKWTTYRAAAEQLTDPVLSALGKTRRVHTESLAIGGGRGFPVDQAEQRTAAEAIAKETGISHKRASQLCARYGSNAARFATAEQGQNGQPIEGMPDYTYEELAVLTSEERVSRTADVILRRTAMALEYGLTRSRVAAVNAAVGQALGWSTVQTDAEEQHVCGVLEDVHRVNLI